MVQSPAQQIQDGGRPPSWISKNRDISVTVMTYRREIWRDVFAKFGTLRDSDLLRTIALWNWNQKLIRDVNGRHLENLNDVISPNYAADRTIHIKFGVQMLNEMPMSVGRLKP